MKEHSRTIIPICIILLWCLSAGLLVAEKKNVLLIDGQNKHHDWEKTSAAMMGHLNQSGRFSVTRITSPLPKKPNNEWLSFRPDFSKYDLVILNYWGEPWPEGYFEKLKNYLAAGGGLVTAHSSLAAFSDKEEFANMVGLKWSGLKTGKRVYFDQHGSMTTIENGHGVKCGHSKIHVFSLKPIAGSFLQNAINPNPVHHKDELYHGLRGPAQKIEFHATANSPITLHHEPVIWGLPYKKGRSFVTILGHTDHAMQSQVFKNTFINGCLWAAGVSSKTISSDLIQLPASNSQKTP
jgi:predicted ribosomally synthesized peptide with SipW-like signal peptide